MKYRILLLCTVLLMGLLVVPAAGRHGNDGSSTLGANSTVSKGYVGGGLQGFAAIFCPDQLFLESDPVVGGNPTGVCTGGHVFIVPKNATHVTLSVNDDVSKPVIGEWIPKPDPSHSGGSHNHQAQRFCDETTINITKFENNHDSGNYNMTELHLQPQYYDFASNSNVCGNGAADQPTKGTLVANWSDQS